MSPPSELERVSNRKIEKRRHKKTHKNTNNHTNKTTHDGGGAMDLHREPTLNQADPSLSLAKHVISAHAKNKNFVFSPLSIQIVLGMIASGSNGPTRDQLLGFLKSKSTEELNSLSSQIMTRLFANTEGRGSGPCLSAANGVWVDESLSFKPAFKEIVHDSYKAASNHVDFQTKAKEVRKEVNQWAKKETNGLIKDILPRGSVDATTRLIFANALYFNGAWATEFKESSTKDGKFFLLNGSSIQVPFLTSWKDQSIRAFDGFKVLGLPYKHGRDFNRRFSMYFYLPDAKDGLPSLLEKFCSEPGFIENHLPGRKVPVGDFRIPKFKIGFDFEASGVLKGLGVVLPFSMGGLTEMVDSAIDGKLLYVSRIFHKSSIEVNEKGTEAAAATVTVMMCGCPMTIKEEEKEVDFVADHPFLFVVREDFSGAVLFIGQLLNPLTG